MIPADICLLLAVSKLHSETPEGQVILKRQGMPQARVGEASMARVCVSSEQSVAKPRKKDYIVRE